MRRWALPMGSSRTSDHQQPTERADATVITSGDWRWQQFEPGTDRTLERRRRPVWEAGGSGHGCGSQETGTKRRRQLVQGPNLIRRPEWTTSGAGWRLLGRLAIPDQPSPSTPGPLPRSGDRDQSRDIGCVPGQAAVKGGEPGLVPPDQSGLVEVCDLAVAKDPAQVDRVVPDIIGPEGVTGMSGQHPEDPRGRRAV